MSAELRASRAVGPCESCGQSELVMRVVLEAWADQKTLGGYFCIQCVLAAVDEALQTRFENQAKYVLAARGASTKPRRPRLIKGGVTMPRT